MNSTNYVVAINDNGTALYLTYETTGQLDSKTMETIKEPTGFFTDNLNKALRFANKELAEATAVAYEKSQIIEIEGE